MVDKLVAKFKKLVNEDKRRLNIEDSNDTEETIIEKPSKRKKILLDDDEPVNNKFNETQKDTFVSSEILTRSERNTNKKFTKSLSESQMHKTHSFGRRSFSSSKSKKSSEQSDKIVSLISSTISYIQTNKENFSLSVIIDKLNEILDAHIASLSEMRVASTNLDQKEIIMNTKYETAEKLAKNFELKYLTAEKEKTRLNKQLDEMIVKYNQMKEKNELNVQKNEEMIRLEKNNYVLMQTNEELNRKINEMNVKGDFVKKKYEEEVKEIKAMMKMYKERLNEIEEKVYNKKNNVNNNENEDKTMTLNSLQ